MKPSGNLGSIWVNVKHDFFNFEFLINGKNNLFFIKTRNVQGGNWMCINMDSHKKSVMKFPQKETWKNSQEIFLGCWDANLCK